MRSSLQLYLLNRANMNSISV